jgi:hypothetical protein
MVNELDLHYPPDACPFCNIAAAFPATASSPLWQPTQADLMDAVPSEAASNPEKTSPNAFVVLAGKDVMAFLDILPMTRGKFLK